MGELEFEVKIEFVGHVFSRGLAIPPHLRLVCDDGSTVELRTAQQMLSPFWRYFCTYAFSQEEMRDAIRRLVATERRGALLATLGTFPQIPEVVGDRLAEVRRQFRHVELAICDDPSCAAVEGVHAHAYREGSVLPRICFRTREAALRWVNDHRSRLKSHDAERLRARIDDWPGMPNERASGPHSHAA